ncbi:DUF6383 domain-containing protein [Parabacteroides sp. AF17-28]|uniref:DUF6383 domain-containing protein n=1 Tax=Parabacteroides sp. AF17-28 TaxID=2292241 RepID=UPI0011C38B0D|nr:DUF6383 domain-containing protein [Parabacteroides sp. AF17-28]
MNKRFSTLLAAVMVAGGLSSTASASAYADDAVTNGSWVHLKTVNGSTEVLTIDADGTLGSLAVPTASNWNTDTQNKLASLWRVNKTAKQGTTGAYFTYTFTSKTGQLLSIKLVSDQKDGGRKAAITANEKGGNTEWLWDDTLGLYAYNTKGDSVFTLDYNRGIVLHAEEAIQGVLPTTPTTQALVKVDVDGADVVLNAAAFNAFAKDSKVYFPGANVSTGQKNILTDKEWEAVDGKISTGAFADPSSSPTHIFLTVKGETHKGSNLDMTDVDADKATYLVVDYKNYYDANSKVYPYLLVDSIPVEPTAAATADQIAARTAFSAATGKGTPRHPFTAAFTAKYDIQKDSISLVAAYVEDKIAVTSMLDGRIKAFTALESALSTASTTQCATLKAEVDKLKKAVGAYYAANNQDKYTNATAFAAAMFESDGSKDNGLTGGDELIGQDFIDAIEIIDVTYTTGTTDADKEKIAAEKAYVAAVDAFVSAIKELKIVTDADNSKPAVVTTKNLTTAYSDGAYAGLEVVAPANGQVIIRDNAGTKTLTIGAAATEIVPAIRFAKSSSLGGDAEIEAGLYYVVDMMKGASNDSKTYGLYIVDNADMGIEYVANAQPFNPYAIYNVENAAGTTKGNFYITALTNTTSKYSGITNVVDAENAVYAIGADTIQLVKADVTVDKHMGYKFMTAPELVNNTYTITSAIDVLEGYGFAMKAAADSAIYAIDGDETAYTLVAAGAATKYGMDDALEKQAYNIKDADGNFVIFENNAYRFANETGDIASKKAAFYLMAVGSESTYVLFDTNNSGYEKLIVESRTKQIMSEALDGAKNNTFFVAAVPAPASYKSLPKHVSIKALNGDNVAVNAANQGVVAREGDLKASYTAEDFTFWLDTAHYENAETFTYYVTKGTEDSRLFMYNSVDSSEVQDADKKFPYIYGADASCVIFLPAAVLGQDTLIVNATDTVSIAKGTSKDGLKHAVKAGVKNFQFSFEFASKDAEGEYNIVCQNKDGKNYVHNINGVLAMGAKANALVVDVKDAEAPTANESAPSVSEVKVIATNGGVQIIGAAGKKVVITNILGQTVANTVLSSDNATIAAPAGVVVVAIEGEEAVKAIVK